MDTLLWIGIHVTPEKMTSLWLHPLSDILPFVLDYWYTLARLHFFLEYAGELRIIALRRRVVKYNTHTTHTLSEQTTRL
jgi:hypothetical protein